MPPPQPPPDDRFAACLMAALAGDPAVAEVVLITAECVVETGGFDPDGLRYSGLGVRPPAGLGAIVLRGVPYGLLFAADRPRLRKGAHTAADVAGVDEESVAATVATAVLAADLARGFDIETCLLRCHQTLLEEAPTAILTRLRLLDPAAPLTGVEVSPVVIVQFAATALSRARGVDACVACFDPPSDVSPAAITLTAALAGLRDGFEGFDVARLHDHPLAARAQACALALTQLAAPV